MIEPLKKALLGLLGAVSLSPQEIQAIVDGLVSQGSLSREQGQKLYQALLRHSQKENEEVTRRLGRELHRLSELMPLISRGELRRLEERVRRIEERLGLAAQAPEEVPGRSDREMDADREAGYR